MAQSNAVAQNRVSAAIGYELGIGQFGNTSGYLPQSIAILAEANTANQNGLASPTPAPVQITSAKDAATLCGSGSPAHRIASILFPLQGGGVAVPVMLYPQLAAVGSTARVQTLTVTGTANANVTHYVYVAGRNNVDGQFYQVNVNSGDTATVTAGKISDAINAVTSAPVTATSTGAVVTITTKWTGLTAQGVNLSMDTSLGAGGVTYAIAETAAGSGTPAVTASLNLFGSRWNTMVINSYGLVDTTCTELETFNGFPQLNGATGRYSGLIFKPMIALTGSVADDPSSSTATRNAQCTIVVCPAPLSPGLQFEAAANVAYRLSPVFQNTPAGDVIGQTYPDMPMPDATTTIAMQDSTTRDVIVKKGCSTVLIDSDLYKIVDLVTTFNDNTQTPAYRWARNMNIDWNIKYKVLLIQEANVKGKAIVDDNAVVSVDNTISPKQVRALLASVVDEAASQALIADKDFSKKSIAASINGSNPDRIDSNISYKRSGTARIQSDTVLAGFYFGS